VRTAAGVRSQSCFVILRSRHIAAKHSLIGRHCPIAACHISCTQLNGYQYFATTSLLTRAGPPYFSCTRARSSALLNFMYPCHSKSSAVTLKIVSSLAFLYAWVLGFKRIRNYSDSWDGWSTVYTRDPHAKSGTTGWRQLPSSNHLYMLPSDTIKGGNSHVKDQNTKICFLFRQRSISEMGRDDEHPRISRDIRKEAPVLVVANPFAATG
jgi:hypothetical protein